MFVSIKVKRFSLFIRNPSALIVMAIKSLKTNKLQANLVKNFRTLNIFCIHKNLGDEKGNISFLSHLLCR